MRKYILIERVATAGAVRVSTDGASGLLSESIEALADGLAWFPAGETVSSLGPLSPDGCRKTDAFFRDISTSGERKITHLTAKKTGNATSKPRK